MQHQKFPKFKFCYSGSNTMIARILVYVSIVISLVYLSSRCEQISYYGNMTSATNDYLYGFPFPIVCLRCDLVFVNGTYSCSPDLNFQKSISTTRCLHTNPGSVIYFGGILLNTLWWFCVFVVASKLIALKFGIKDVFICMLTVALFMASLWV